MNIHLPQENPVNQFEYCPKLDILFAASDDNIASFSLSNYCCSKQILYYDICNRPTSIKLQRWSEQPNAATWNHSSLHLWDLENITNSLFSVKLFNDENKIKIFEWFQGNTTNFATTTYTNVVKLWDKRLQNPYANFTLGNQKIDKLCTNQFDETSIVYYLRRQRALIIQDIRVQSDNSINMKKLFVKRLPFYDIRDITWKDQKSLYIVNADQSIRLLQLGDEEQSDITLYEPVAAYSSSTESNSLPTTAIMHMNWNHSNELVMIRSSSKSTPDKTTFTLLSQSKESTTPVDTSFARSRQFISSENIVTSFWRSNLSHNKDLDSYGIVSSTGHLRFYDIDLTHPETAITSPTISHRYCSLSSQCNYEVKTALGINALHKYFNHDHDNIQATPSSSSATNKNVVGPRTFMKLLGDEIKIIEIAIHSTMFSGLSLSLIDSFNRIISFEYSSSQDKSAIFNNTNNNTNNTNATMSGSYFGLERSLSDAYNHRISFTITFSKKLNQFWNFTMTLENRSIIKVKRKMILILCVFLILL
jgi:hypothetical protein